MTCTTASVYTSRPASDFNLEFLTAEAPRETPLCVSAVVRKKSRRLVIHMWGRGRCPVPTCVSFWTFSIFSQVPRLLGAFFINLQLPVPRFRLLLLPAPKFLEPVVGDVDCQGLFLDQSLPHDEPLAIGCDIVLGIEEHKRAFFE